MSHHTHRAIALQAEAEHLTEVIVSLAAPPPSRRYIHQARAHEWRRTVKEIQGVLRGFPDVTPDEAAAMLEPGHHCAECKLQAETEEQAA